MTSHSVAYKVTKRPPTQARKARRELAPQLDALVAEHVTRDTT
jgi:hypothetical protein